MSRDTVLKSTNNFTRAIQSYLEQRAEFDDLFAVNFAKAHKNIEECVVYILSWVQKSGCFGFCDDEIFSQAVHYYDEDDIEVGAMPDNCMSVVNHTVELTEEEREQARKDAIAQVQREHIEKMTRKAHKPKKVEEPTNTPSLFDF